MNPNAQPKQASGGKQFQSVQNTQMTTTVAYQWNCNKKHFQGQSKQQNRQWSTSYETTSLPSWRCFLSSNSSSNSCFFLPFPPLLLLFLSSFLLFCSSFSPLSLLFPLCVSSSNSSPWILLFRLCIFLLTAEHEGDRKGEMTGLWSAFVW